MISEIIDYEMVFPNTKKSNQLNCFTLKSLLSQFISNDLSLNQFSYVIQP